MTTLRPSQNKALPGKQGARMSRRWASYKWLWQNNRAMALNQKAAEPGSSSIARQSCRRGGLLLSQIKCRRRRNGEQAPSRFDYTPTSRSAVPPRPSGTHTRGAAHQGLRGVSLRAVSACSVFLHTSPTICLSSESPRRQHGWERARDRRLGGGTGREERELELTLFCTSKRIRSF